MKSFKLLFLIGVVFILCDCRKDDPLPIPVPEPVYPTIQFEGAFELSPDDTTSLSDLTILSLTDETELSDDGSFNLESIENQKYQIFMASSEISGETTYYGISDPGTGEVLINDSTTALGLLLINPYLFGSEQEQRKQYLDEASKASSFKELVSAIAEARKTNPNDPLNIDLHPEISQISTELMISTMKKLGEGDEAETKYGEEFIKVVDKAENNVIFENYRHVFYSADINYPFTSENDVELLSRKEKAFKWVWKWWYPHWESTKPAATSYKMDDGYVEINYYKFASGKIGDKTDNAKGVATRLNLVYSIAYLLDMWGGLLKEDDGILVEIGINIATQSLVELANLDVAIRHGDEFQVMEEVVALLKSEIGMTILKRLFGTIDAKWSNQLTGGLKKILFAYNCLGYANEHIPFFVDLVKKTPEGPFKYIHLNGVLTAVNENLPPEASIGFSPGIGYGETQVTFKVTDYMDDYTPQESAMFSWQWLEDGIELPEDDSWSEESSSTLITMTLSSPGRMWLKVDDKVGGEYICSKELPFYESVAKSRIIVVSDLGYFQSYKTYLEDSLNFRDGAPQPGELHYIMTTPSDFNSLAIRGSSEWKLDPATDLLIFHQTESFTTGYSEVECFNDNKLAISNFISKGGNFYFIIQGPYELPVDSINFGGKIVISYDAIRYVRNNSESNRYFVSDYISIHHLEDWNYFLSFPDNAQIHLVGSLLLTNPTSPMWHPVLFEINSGLGTALFSTLHWVSFARELYPMYHNTMLYLLGAEFK